MHHGQRTLIGITPLDSTAALSVKLVFDVQDVGAFAAANPAYGKVHKVPGYEFANAKDPSGNSVQVSSRAFSGT